MLFPLFPFSSHHSVFSLSAAVQTDFWLQQVFLSLKMGGNGIKGKGEHEMFIWGKTGASETLRQISMGSKCIEFDGVL